MKKTLVIISVVACGAVFAQEREFILGVGLEDGAQVERQILLAQQAPPPPPEPHAVPGTLPPPPIGGGAAHLSASPGQPGRAEFSQRLAGVVQRGDGFATFSAFDDGAKRTLLVGFNKLDTTSRQNIQEDMQIMSRILDKAAEHVLQSAQDHRMGIALMTLPGARGENIYLEDYGPVFVLNVPMPLSDAGKVESGKEEKEDSDWEQAKRELYQNKPFGAFDAMKYDAQKVDVLKKALIEALKNAANIRQLKSDQTVTVVVSGGANTHAVFAKSIIRKNDYNRGKDNKDEVFEKKVVGPPETTLSLRVKKSDAEAFNKGKLSLEEFTKKVAVSSN